MASASLESSSKEGREGMIVVILTTVLLLTFGYRREVSSLRVSLRMDLRECSIELGSRASARALSDWVHVEAPRFPSPNCNCCNLSTRDRNNLPRNNYWHSKELFSD